MVYSHFLFYYQLCIMFAIIIKQVRTFIPTIIVLIIATILSCSFVLSSLKLPILNFHTVHNFFISILILSIIINGTSLVSFSKPLVVPPLLFYQLSLSCYFYYFFCYVHRNIIFSSFLVCRNYFSTKLVLSYDSVYSS